MLDPALAVGLPNPVRVSDLTWQPHRQRRSERITLDLYSQMQESMSRKAADALEEVFGGSAAEGAPRT